MIFVIFVTWMFHVSCFGFFLMKIFFQCIRINLLPAVTTSLYCPLTLLARSSYAGYMNSGGTLESTFADATRNYEEGWIATKRYGYAMPRCVRRRINMIHLHRGMMPSSTLEPASYLSYSLSKNAHIILIYQRTILPCAENRLKAYPSDTPSPL